MSGWQPIETAPKDAPVLVWDGRMMTTACRRSFDDRWYWSADGATGDEWDNAFDDPTHWMPLPDPPGAS